MNTEEYIKQAREVHGDKYIYTNTVYTSSKDPITFLCLEHGEITVARASRHISRGHACRKCAADNIRNKTLLKYQAILCDIGTSETILWESFDGSHVLVKCVNHGIRKSRVCHLAEGRICRKCVAKEVRESKAYLRYTDILTKADKVHIGRYTYDLNHPYVNQHTKIPIECDDHGEFLQSVSNHVYNMQGCPTCALLDTTPGNKNITLYLLKMEVVAGEPFYKVGVTSKDVRRRMYSIRGHVLSHETLRYRKDLPRIIWKQEREYLKLVVRGVEGFRAPGYTECFYAESDDEALDIWERITS